MRPPELPGFYYDPEKNRYFPIRGPIPGGSTSRKTREPVEKPIQATNLYRSAELRTSRLLCLRELNGRVIPLHDGKSNFQEAFQKMQSFHPVAWRYRRTDNIADSAIEQLEIDVETPEGRMKTNILLTGGTNGCISLLEVGKVGELFPNGEKYIPGLVWPHTKDDTADTYKAPGRIWRPHGAYPAMTSPITCIKLFQTNNNRALITTLGAHGGGSVSLLSLSEAVDFDRNSFMELKRLRRAVPVECTIWTADCASNASRAGIGTNLGIAVYDLEAEKASWVFHCRSDVLALQLDPSGNKVICGLRNGAIMVADARAGRKWRLVKHRLPYPFSSSNQVSCRKWFQAKGDIDSSRLIFRPSSISCLALLKASDQYFLASSMDGSIKLYDHRMAGRAAVQSYEGHVNSHSRIQLGVDPSERFVMSGGEDCYVRLWSINSGYLLSESKFSNSIPSVLCWPGRKWVFGQSCPEEDTVFGIWLGSKEGIFHVRS